MAAFIVNHRYAANRDGKTFGPYAPGDFVELEDGEADWINRDSPGALHPAVVAKPAPAAADPPSTEASADGEADPVQDRGHRGGRKRGGG